MKLTHKTRLAILNIMKQKNDLDLDRVRAGNGTPLDKPEAVLVERSLKLDEMLKRPEEFYQTNPKPTTLTP